MAREAHTTPLRATRVALSERTLVVRTPGFPPRFLGPMDPGGLAAAPHRRMLRFDGGFGWFGNTLLGSQL